MDEARTEAWECFFSLLDPLPADTVSRVILDSALNLS